MPAPDRVTPLADATDMDQSGLRDLIRALDVDELDDLMVKATRACEAACGGRRLAPFTVTETHRAEGVDPSEFGAYASPGDFAATISASYSRMTGAGGTQVRKVWLDQFAPLFPDMWSYGDDLTIRVYRTEGSMESLPRSVIIGEGPVPDSGELWFRPGLLVPVGSRVQVTYSGKYDPVPRDLVEACCFMAAASLIDEDNFPGNAPGLNSHADGQQESSRNGDGFLARAMGKLAPYSMAGQR